ncbi:hypothetical protein M1116_03570 [Patescibacteria group bacterium]|nr:hypothetical protein [Patescibacteria group bacterium]
MNDRLSEKLNFKETGNSLKTAATELNHKPAVQVEAANPFKVFFGVNGLLACRILGKNITISGDANVQNADNELLLAVSQGAKSEMPVSLANPETGEISWHKLQLGDDGRLEDVELGDKAIKALGIIEGRAEQGTLAIHSGLSIGLTEGMEAEVNFGKRGLRIVGQGNVTLEEGLLTVTGKKGDQFFCLLVKMER